MRISVVRTIRLALVAAVSTAAAAACRTDARPRGERVTEDFTRSREQAIAALQELDEFCTAREQLIVHASSAGPNGHRAAMEELLRTPDALTDYCLRPHAH
ncbi:MAG: hypothetical protein HY561_07020 [Gemmatimonadetes bacterium]|nr:hypothetical protein [Gemmatimonadota bacterium]